MNYHRNDGSTRLHVVKECPRDYFLVYIVREGWPLFPRFNNILRRFSEAGLLNLWYQQVERAFLTYKFIHRNPIEDTTKKRQPFSFLDIQTAFYILGLGQLASLIVFIAEVFLPPKKRKHHWTRKRTIVKSIVTYVLMSGCRCQCQKR